MLHRYKRQAHRRHCGESGKNENSDLGFYDRSYKLWTGGSTAYRDNSSQFCAGKPLEHFNLPRADYPVSVYGALLKTSIIILAGGPSKRLGKDKGLVELKGKALITHILEKVAKIVDEEIIVVGSATQKNTFSPLCEPVADVIVDKYDGHSPLVGALTGFEAVHSAYSLLLPCDTPFLSSKIVTMLLDRCIGRDAAIPRWPNGWIEPLQAAYNTKSAMAAAKKALDHGKRDMASLIDSLEDVRYVSTQVLRELDPKLLSFFNINTFEDLQKAESMEW